MNPRTRKRLDAIESRLSPDENLSGVVFVQLKGETNDEMRARMARWYAGEKVEGQERTYTGQWVGVVEYVKAKCPFPT